VDKSYFLNNWNYICVVQIQFRLSMKLLLSISLLIIMIASVAVPVVAQWQGEDVCEVKGGKSEGDSDDEFKVGKEKEVYVSNGHFSLILAAFSSEKTSEKQYHKLDCLISENHAQRLEMPPDA
jgi:hypothetical protein